MYIDIKAISVVMDEWEHLSDLELIERLKNAKFLQYVSGIAQLRDKAENFAEFLRTIQSYYPDVFDSISNHMNRDYIQQCFNIKF